uniref:Beta-1,4-galactosyltransferase n=1 Tax=Schistosoma mansoni TaxID=6183 RepID=A0A5K4F3Z1_SCHMA
MFSKKKSSFRIYYAISKAVGLIFCTIFLLQIYFMRTTVKYVTLQNLTAEAIIPSNTTPDVCKQTCRTICKNIDSVPSSKVNGLKPMGKMPFTGEFNEEMNLINDTFYPQSLDGSWMFKEETTDCSNVLQSGVAIIIVCRDRWKQLNNTLSSLIPVLQRQHLCYRIFVIEQKGTGILNKARLMNVGFIEARKRFDFNCVIFHDADLIPLDDRIPHGCDEETMESVVHLSVGHNNELTKKLHENLLNKGELYLVLSSYHESARQELNQMDTTMSYQTETTTTTTTVFLRFVSIHGTTMKDIDYAYKKIASCATEILDQFNELNN